MSSGNTFGARYYTDGKQVAPMMLQIPAVVECQGCKGLFWLGQAEEVAAFDAYGCQTEPVDPTWTAAGELREPAANGYLDRLETLRLAEPARERELRLLAWWRGNDRNREALSARPECESGNAGGREANMRALLAVLHEAVDEDLLMRAEIHRQLGEFDQSLAVLSSPMQAYLEAAVKRIRSLCEAGDRHVRTLF